MMRPLLYAQLSALVIAVALSACSHDDGYPNLSPPDPPGMFVPEVGLSMAEVDFDCGGGLVEINVTSNVPLSLAPSSGVTDEETPCGNFESVAPLSVTASLADSVLIVGSGANGSCFARSHTVNLFYGDEVVSFVRVHVAGNRESEPRLTMASRQELQQILDSCASTMAMADSMQLNYCGVPVADGRYSDENLQALWTSGFGTVHAINGLREVMRRGGYLAEENVISVYAAVIYTAFVDVWGELPLYTPDNTADDCWQPAVVPSIQLYFSNQLHQAMEECRESVAGVVTGTAQACGLSKDVVRMALADIYMQQGKYRFAAEQLEEVVHSRRYTLTDDASGIILGVPAPVYTIADAYLKLAECHLQLGEPGVAATYVEAVLDAAQWPDTDVLNTVDYLRRRLRLPGYTAFRKRNSLLGDIPSLWPVPPGVL